MGYTFKSTGEVISPLGNQLSCLVEDRRTGCHVSLLQTTNGIRKLIRVNVQRAIYVMFSDDTLDRKDVVILKDLNKGPSIDNLVKIPLSQWHKSGKKGRSKQFDEQACEDIIERYLFGNYTYSQLAKLFNCSTVTISKIVNNSY